MKKFLNWLGWGLAGVIGLFFLIIFTTTKPGDEIISTYSIEVKYTDNTSEKLCFDIVDKYEGKADYIILDNGSVKYSKGETVKTLVCDVRHFKLHLVAQKKEPEE